MRTTERCGTPTARSSITSRFPFRDLPAAYQRIRKQGVAIVRPMARDEEYGFRHFFVRAPNGVLVELLEAKPWPDAAWER